MIDITHKEIDLRILHHIAQRAAEAIMQVYESPFATEVKEDKSPLTEADKQSNAVIVKGLTEHYPAIPIISEENKLTPYEERKHWKRFWLVDPLDGTKEFIKRNGEFTVNIALIEEGVPVVGVVYIPVSKTGYIGVAGQGTYRVEHNGEVVKLNPTEHYMQKQTVIVVGSRSHLTDETLAFVEKLKSQGKQVEFISSGSSLKFCLVAEGKADVYPRFGPTMEWDTAAAHAVAANAGKQVLIADTDAPLTYNKENLLNPYFIVG